MPKILILDDDKHLAEMLKSALDWQKHLVDLAHDGKEGGALLQASEYDLLVLDWNLPYVSGIEICREYRSRGGKAQVIMLTGKCEVQDKENGLDSGADVYLTKPVHIREFLAAVRAALRRTASEYADYPISVGGVVLDARKHVVLKDGKPVDLVPKEFALLEFFMRNPESVFSAETLMARVWSTDSESSPDVVRKYISSLRTKLGREGKPPVISTVYGIGYRFERDA